MIVTHDISEALLLGNRIALMEAGETRGMYFRTANFCGRMEPVASSYIAQLHALEEFERNQ